MIVTSAERAKILRHPPVYILGMGQGHPGGDPIDTLISGAPIAKQTAFQDGGTSNWPTSTLPSFTTATPSPCWSPSRTTAFATRARADHLSPTEKRAGRIASGQHRRRTAQFILHVGDDARLRGGDPDSRARAAAASGTQARASAWSPATAGSSQRIRPWSSRLIPKARLTEYNQMIPGDSYSPAIQLISLRVKMPEASKSRSHRQTVPDITPDMVEFFEGARRGQLMVQKCDGCGAPALPAA